MSKRNESIKSALPSFAPHIEARRAHFEQLAECLMTMANLQYGADALDIEPNGVLVPEPDSDRILMNAMEAHMELLLEEVLMLDPASIRRFYVDMRLHVEQMRWEMKQAGEARKASETDAA